MTLKPLLRIRSSSLMNPQYVLEEPKSTQIDEEPQPTSGEENQSRSQQDKIRKLRRKAKVVVDHLDIIKDDFWERRPWILSGTPGKLPV